MTRGRGKISRRGRGRLFSNEADLAKARISSSEEEDSQDGSQDGSEEDPNESKKEEHSEDESSEEEVGTSAAQTLTRTQKRDRKKQLAEGKGKGEEIEDPDLINPNHVQQKLNISDLNTPRELSRREKEQKEKKEAKDRYWKLHVQGKTDEAKADLSRLAKIRAEREAAQAKRQAEAEAKAAEAEARRKAQLAKRTT